MNPLKGMLMLWIVEIRKLILILANFLLFSDTLLDLFFIQTNSRNLVSPGLEALTFEISA